MPNEALMMGTARVRRTLATVVAFAALVAGVFFVAQIMVLRGFDSVDNKAGRENGLRLRFALRAQVLQLQDTGLNWADWTAAYQYVSAKTPAERLSFEREEMSDQSLVSLGCDVFSYLTTEGTKIFAVSIDHQGGRTRPAPPEFIKSLRDSGLSASVKSQSSQMAIISVNGAPMLISIQRVHRSGRNKEWNGAVVVGSWVGTGVKKFLQEQLRLPVEVGSPKNRNSYLSSIPTLRATPLSRPLESRAGDLMNADAGKSISLVEEDEMLRVDTVFSDPRGRPVLAATTWMPRVARKQGRVSLHSFLLALLGLGTISVVVALSLQKALASADAERQRERNYFELLTHHLPDRLFIHDLNEETTRSYGNATSGLTRVWLETSLDSEQQTQRADWLADLSLSGNQAQREWDVNKETWLELVTPVRARGEETPISHLIGAAINISSRKQAEREKDILLKEIHHRVKNNLQIVVSLLNLQADQIHDAEARQAFMDARARVRSMALIHEQLYRQSDLSHVDFGAYLQSLLQLLLRSYSHTPVNLNNQIESLPLDIDIAVPCGLIVTELVANAFKYAFAVPVGLRGEHDNHLTVRLCTESERVLLQIQDNGPGLPADFCLEESDSLGLQIVDSLATQIGATIETCCGEDGRGTCWTLRFEAIESSKQRIQSFA